MTDLDDGSAFASALPAIRAAHLRFRGLPQEDALEILREALERIMLLPETAKYEEAGIGVVDGAAQIALTLLGVPAPVGAVGVKGLDILMHLGVLLATREAAADLAAKRALGDPSTPTPSAG